VLENFEQVIAEVEPFLEQYLERFGIEAADHKMFSCLDPEHEDSTPSCHIVPGHPTVCKCHGCGQSFNIFRACHLLEGKPLTGPLFVTDTLKYLCEMFSIEFKERPLSPEEVHIRRIYQAYADASEYINGIEFNEKAKTEISRRGWDEERLRNLGVGMVPNFATFREYMIKIKHHDAEFLDSVDLGFRDKRPSMIFSTDQIIFSIYDMYGRVYGFAARNLNFSPERDHDKKYVNTHNGEVFQKSQLLYGIHRCKNTDPIYIVEGYADQITLFLNGFTNVVCIGGTAFTDTHLRILLKLGYRDIVLAFDGDKAGQFVTEKIITEYLAGNKDLRISVLTIPNNMDPDDYVREHGIKGWKKLEVQSAFAWRLDRFSAEAEPITICDAMIPIIVNEPQAVHRDGMVGELALRTGVRRESIFADLKRLLDTKAAEFRVKKEEAIKQAAKDAISDPTHASLTFRAAAHHLEDLDKADNADIISSSEFVNVLEHQYKYERDKEPIQEMFHLGSDLKPIEDIFCGADIKRAMCILGGIPNCGKTNLLSKIAVDIAQNNENVTVIFLTIDDDRLKLLSRIMMNVLADEAGDIRLNWLKEPKYYSRFDASLAAKHKIAYDRLISLARDEKLIIKDMHLGKNLYVIDSLLGHFRDKNPDRDLVFLLDNFSLLDMLSIKDVSEDHAKFRKTSAEFKQILQRNKCMGIMTQEYTKLDPWTRPCYNDLKGSSGVPHDADIIMHLYNDLLGNNSRHKEAELYHIDTHGAKLPTIEWIFEKSKVNDFHLRSFFFDAYPYRANFKHVTEDEIIRRRAIAKTLKGEEPPKYDWRDGQGTEVPQKESKPAQRQAARDHKRMN
jgi:DNA primase catalytic core